MPVPAGGIPNPVPGCPTAGAPAPGGTELVGGTVPCGGTPADHVAGVTFGCQLAPPVNFLSPAFHWRSPLKGKCEKQTKHKIQREKWHVASWMLLLGFRSGLLEPGGDVSID